MSKSTARLLVCAVAALLLPSGCRKGRPTEPTARIEGPQVVPVVEPPPAPGAKPISDVEAEKFALELQTAVLKKDAAKVVSLMRVDRIVERVLVEVNPSEASQRAIRATFKPRTGEGFARKLIANLQPGVRFDLLRVRRSADGPVAVYRLLGEPGMNYYLMTLERTEGGEVAVRDYSVVMDGMPIGETVRRNILEGEAAFGPAARSKLKERDRNAISALEQSGAFVKLANDGKHAEALEAYRKLPPDIRAERMTHFVAVHCALQVNEVEFAKEFTAFRDAMPNDPSLLFMSLSFHESRGEHQEYLKAIDAIEAVVGADPHLDVLRSRSYHRQGKGEEAVATAEKAARLDPTLGEAYWQLAELRLAQKEFAKVASALRAVIEQGKEDFDPEQLVEEKAYTEFCKSPEFTEFRKWYAARKK